MSRRQRRPTASGQPGVPPMANDQPQMASMLYRQLGFPSVTQEQPGMPSLPYGQPQVPPVAHRQNTFPPVTNGQHVSSLAYEQRSAPPEVHLQPGYPPVAHRQNTFPPVTNGQQVSPVAQEQPMLLEAYGRYGMGLMVHGQPRGPDVNPSIPENARPRDERPITVYASSAEDAIVALEILQEATDFVVKVSHTRRQSSYHSSIKFHTASAEAMIQELESHRGGTDFEMTITGPNDVINRGWKKLFPVDEFGARYTPPRDEEGNGDHQGANKDGYVEVVDDNQEDNGDDHVLPSIEDD